MNALMKATVTVALTLLTPATIVNGLVSPAPKRAARQKAQEGQGLELKEPPRPMKWPIVGTLPDFLARGGIDAFNEVHESMYNDYGPVYGMSILGNDELVVSDPLVFDYVMKNEGRLPVGAAEQVTTFRDYYKENDLQLALKSLSRGAEWKEWRRSLNKDMFVFWDKYLPDIAEAAASASAVAGKEIKSGRLTFEDFNSRLAFDMFSSVLYGENPATTNAGKADPEDIVFVKNTQQAFDTTGALMADPVAKLFGSQLYQDFKTSMDVTFAMGLKKTSSFVQKARKDQQQQHDPLDNLGATAATQTASIRETTSDGESSKCPIQGIKSAVMNSNSSSKSNPSFIERLVQRGELSDDDISQVSSPLLMAGVDTTAYVMSWLYLNLASNPEVQQRLAKELQDVLQGADITTKEQIEQLPYLRACVRESHRLTPSAPLSVKNLENDLDIVVNGARYRVEAEHRISLNLRAIPMDPNYVDNPTQYKPERFLPEAIEARIGTPSELIDHPLFEDPFGRGKRRCLGGNVAYAEIYAAVARMVQDWDIKLPETTVEWKPKMDLMLKAYPYPKIELEERK